MNSRRPKSERVLKGAVAVLAIAWACSAGAAPLVVPNTPLFLANAVKPNIIIAVDDSGSMDSEVLLPTNDGAAWWRTNNSSGSCTAATGRSFVGCTSNGTTDLPSSGSQNFNRVGDATATWKKFVNLFPNGYNSAVQSDQRRYEDAGSSGAHAHFAIAPIAEFAYFRSPDFNAGYFDPSLRYDPWVNGGGHIFANITSTNAPYDPAFGTNRINLTLDQTGRITTPDGAATGAACNNAGLGASDANGRFRMFTGMTLPAGTCFRPNGGNWQVASAGGVAVGPTPGTIPNDTSVAIRYFPATFYLLSPMPASYSYTGTASTTGRGPAGQTLYGYEIKPANFASTAAYNNAVQNFANWFTYYRKRHQGTRGGIVNAFSDLNNLRIGSFTINNRTNPLTMRDIDVATDRTAFFTAVYDNYVNNGGTPNRAAVANILTQYRRTDAAAPITQACQQNFGILFTDGYTTLGSGEFGATDNADGTYGAPYADSVSDTLADGVMRGYVNNLRPTLSTGKVPKQNGCVVTPPALPDPRLDCNPNLHMNFFAVTLATAGIAYDPDNTVDPYVTPPTWPTAPFFNRNPSAVDDLWHATINGRGQLLNARSPQDVSTKLKGVLDAIAARTGSSAAASLNSTSLNAGTRLFQGGFNSAQWTGMLTATPISTGPGASPPGPCPMVAIGRLCSQAWEASEELARLEPYDATDRVILTFDRTAKTGIAFTWASLPAAQQTLLNLNPVTLAADTRGQDRLNYLRGDRSMETGPNAFRPRGSPLGDIVNSDPFFVGAPNAGLPFTGYSAFRAANKGRTPMVYVGANDGMLHGFRVSDGSELLAYVPGMMFGSSTDPKLAKLTARPYTHIWGVDGSVTVGDVQIGASNDVWASYLVGPMRAGGKGMYALDVTNPANFLESGTAPAGPASVVKWEFTDADDAGGHMGFTFSQPSIVKMKNGKWAAVFGNGYNSTSGQAALYIVFLNGPSSGTWTSGTHYIKIPVGPVGVDNGLAGAAPVDLDGDGLVDYIFAGDLKGNMWQFNVNDMNSANWKVAYSTPPTIYNPLFVARDADAGATQPITAPPDVGLNLLTAADKNDLVVYFGTGKYIETNDNLQTGQQNQTFYGIFADPIDDTAMPIAERTVSPNPLRSALLEQYVLKEVTVASGQKGRITSQNGLTNQKGWFIDLYNTEGGVTDTTAAGGLNRGERQVSRPIIRSGRIVFATLIPSASPCDFGGSGWLMEIDARDGGRPKKPALDINNDLIVDKTDRYDLDGDGVTDDPDDVAVSGLQSTDGILSTPAVLALTPGQEAKYSVLSDGSTAVFGESGSGRTGRVTWREIAP